MTRTLKHVYTGTTLHENTKNYNQTIRPIWRKIYEYTIVYAFPSVDGTHERKWGKAKKCLQPTRKTHVAEDSQLTRFTLPVLSGLI